MSYLRSFETDGITWGGQQPQMIQKASFLPLYGRRTFIPRPLSDATEIHDSEAEEDTFEPSPTSLRSFGVDSNDTASTQEEIFTPPIFTAGLGGFDFHIDNVPHQVHSEPHVRSWSTDQVAEWMADSGLDVSIIEKFLSHDISGSVLLDLKIQDLKEIEIASFGKRHKVMSSIEQLKRELSLSIPALQESSTPPVSQQTEPLDESDLPTPHAETAAPKGLISDYVAAVPNLPWDPKSTVTVELSLERPWEGSSLSSHRHDWHGQSNQADSWLLSNAAEHLEETQSSDLPVMDLGSAVPPELFYNLNENAIFDSSVTFELVESPFPVTHERLNQIQTDDPQENVRQFLSFHSSDPTPSSPRSRHLGLPKLTIPIEHERGESPNISPISALSRPNAVQVELKAQLRKDPFHYGGIASPVDYQRMDAPYSAIDKTNSLLFHDPIRRNISRSVPPQMTLHIPTLSPPTPVESGPHLTSPLSARSSKPFSAFQSVPSPVQISSPQSVRSPRKPSFVPSFAAVREDVTKGDGLGAASYCGWMQKRKTSKFMRQEWQDAYFTLEGNFLIMHDDATPQARQLESISVEQYTISACASSSPSKLPSGFRKSIMPGSKVVSPEPSFGFSLILDIEIAKRTGDKVKQSHHFTVNSTKERVEWMRQLMLAKALKKNDPDHRF